jgi:hypothetical protein
MAKTGASGLVNFAVSKDGCNIADQLWLLYDPEMPVGPRFVQGPALAWQIHDGQPLNTDGSFKITNTIEIEDEVWEMVTQGQVSDEGASGTLRIFRHSPLAAPWSSGPLAWTAKRLPF